MQSESAKDEQKEPMTKDGAQQPKKPYSTPTLTLHGTVEELTRAVGPGLTDGIEGSQL